MDMKKQESQRRGFTLIELLVVITIIGLLAAIIVPAINGAFRTAKKARAMQQCKDLQGACQRYFSEYNRMPVPQGVKHGNGDKSYGDDNKAVVDILILADGLANRTTVNPRNIRFLDLDAKTQEAYEDNKNKGLLDPWGEAYQILLDMDFDDRISAGGVEEFKAKVGVRCAGPDGKWDTKDDIKTW